MRFISVFTLLLGIGATGLGGLYKFSSLTPRTLKEYLEWQGLNLISHSSDNYWKAVLEDSQDVAKKATGKENPTIEDLKKWCIDNLPKEKYDDFKVYAVSLCVDNPKTVKARIIQLDGDISKLMSSNDDDKYKVAYVFRKHIDGFHNLIGYKPEIGNHGKEIENLDAAKSAFKKWCSESLDKPMDDILVLNIRTLCTPKKFSTILDLIKQNKEDKLLLTEDNNSFELMQKYEIIKELSTWKEDEGGRELPKTFNNLKNWCETNKNKPFYEEKVFSGIYPKFRFRCLKGVIGIPS
ncbi:hypothetical protein MHC_04250 [Mycoplasma haemocanis str. Illinois]|uniref:Uncharacterized protein n=1 Tax=Mycoplasma haemocanis (strain Illinois) TaxID=1111676 RepID=H6N7T4_MYCHN|nr:hypothetical protein [Mycoplasma haemocanis]AEW45706.1 hypothetical protein MHC_04250 [Mycoplasma haemocanis str. Illinois]